MIDGKVIKATVWYLVSNIFLKGMGYISMPIFSRLLSKEEYGAFTNYVTWQSIITIVASLSLIAALVRARFEFKEKIEDFIASNLVLGFFATLVIGIIMHLNIDFFSYILSLDDKYIYIMLISILFYPAYDMYILTKQFQYEYKTVALFSLVISISTIVLSISLIELMDDHLLARVVGNSLPLLLVSMFIFVKYLICASEIRWKYCRYSLYISLPYIFHLLSGTILHSSDKTMITKMCGYEDNALYSMAYGIAMIINVIWSSMNGAFSPWLGEKLNVHEYTTIRRYSKYYLIVFAAITALLMLIAPELFLLFGGTNYMDAKFVIPPVMNGYFLIFLYSLYVNIEQYEKKTLGMAVATGGAAMLNVLLNYYSIPLYGYIASAYTTLFCYFVMTVIHYYLVRRMKLSFIYDNFFNLYMAIAVSIFTVISLYSYKIILLRYTMVSLLLVLFYYFGKKYNIINLLKKRGEEIV